MISALLVTSVMKSTASQQICRALASAAAAAGANPSSWPSTWQIAGVWLTTTPDGVFMAGNAKMPSGLCDWSLITYLVPAR